MNNSLDGTAWQLAFHPLSIMRMLWKQKLMVLAVWLLLAAAAVVGVLAMPAVYRAETLILVDSQKIPERFVSTTVSADLRERLASLSQQILSSSHLWKIIETFDLYSDERRRGLPVEDVLEKMRQDISIRVEKGWTDQHPGAFRVSFEGKTPAILAEVANQLGNLFVDEDMRAREVHAADTQEFIQSQLEQAKKSLDEQEKQVSQYKLEHNGELPEQESALTASLSQLSVQLQGNQDAISRCYTNQVTLQSGLRLSETVAEVSERLNARQQETAAAGEEGRSPELRPEKLLPEMEAELASLLTKYTEAYPRVRLLRASIARLKALEQREQLAAAVDPQHTESLKAQLAAVDRELKERQQENQRLIQEIQVVRSHLRQIPVREQEMASLTREYEMSKANYKSLQDKLYAAEMAADLERRQKAERFTILEPARVPERPVKPNRPLLASLGCLVALLGGVMVGLAREFRKNTVLGEWEVPATTPVQGRVPTIGTRKPGSPSVRVRLQARGGVDRLLSPFMNEGADAGHASGGCQAMPVVEEQAHSGPSIPMSPTHGRNRHLSRQVISVRSASAAICLHNADPLALEQYRITRTKIAHHPLQPKLVVVTSACAGDGKTISAINLATVFALRTDVRVLLLEADFRRSCLADYFGVPPGPGVADVLSGKCELSEAIVSLKQLPNLCVLPAGTCVANPAELLETPAWHSMCRSLREQFAFILFDAPPVAAVADYELIEKICDGVLLVVRPDHTDRNLFQMAHGFVASDKMLGVLMNGTEDWFLWKVPDYSYYSRARSR